MHKNLNAGAVAAAVLAFVSLVAGAADTLTPAAKDKPVADTRAGREAQEKALHDKREAQLKARAKADNAKQLTGAEQKALATKAREKYEQSVREKKAAAVAADKAGRDKAQQLTGAEQKALATKAREEHEESAREKSGKGDMKASAKGAIKADARPRGDKVERTPEVDPATRRAAEESARKNPAINAADPPKRQ